MAEFFEENKPVKEADYEAYIRKLVISYENRLAQQKDRIFALVDENKNLSAQLDVFKGRDAQITKALMIAVSKAKEIEDAAKQKYDMEIERLRLFHYKWVSYYAEMKNKLPLNRDMLSAEAFLSEMDKILGLQSSVYSKKDDDAVSQFLDESRRLDKIKEKKTAENTAETAGPVKAQNAPDKENLKADPSDKIAAAKDEGEIRDIDMNEVLNPKNLPELKELIRQIEQTKQYEK